MGGNSSRALNAVTTAITAALGGQTDLQVVTNTLAPYAAQVIGKEFGHGEDKNTAAQLVSHAILGATLAYINGGDPTAGGSAAVASEAAANYLTNQLAENYKDDPKYFVNGEFQANLLSETEKAQIRDLTAGIGAVIGGAVGDSTYNAQLAGVIGQNAVENNEFSIITQGTEKVIAETKKKKELQAKWSADCKNKSCVLPVDKSFSDHTLELVNNLTVRQLAAVMGAEYDPLTREKITPNEREDAKAAMLGLGFSKTLNGPIILTKEVLTSIEKKYGSQVAKYFSQKAAGNSKVKIENNFYKDDDFFTDVSEKMAFAKKNNWKTSEGRTLWPPNDGIVPNSQFQTTLPVGAKLDRFGGTSDKSSFLAPVDVPLDARALSPATNTKIRDVYEVVKPLPVVQSKVMPWFDKKGMGIQYETIGIKMTVKELVEQGYLRKVKK